jgi:hypothetical protein
MHMIQMKPHKKQKYILKIEENKELDSTVIGHRN